MSITNQLSPAIPDKFTIKKPRSAPRFCQKTYVATGQHEALIAIPDDNPEGYIEQLDEYNFQEISDEFFNDGTPYPFPIVFYGPGRKRIHQHMSSSLRTLRPPGLTRRYLVRCPY